MDLSLQFQRAPTNIFVDLLQEARAKALASSPDAMHPFFMREATLIDFVRGLNIVSFKD